MYNEEEFELRIDVTLQNRQNYANALRVNESMMVTAANFLEMAAILGEVHKLVQEIKKPHEASRG